MSRLPINLLDLLHRKQTFYNGIVIAITDGSDRQLHVRGRASLSKLQRSALRTMIRMMNDVRGMSSSDRLGQAFRQSDRP